MSWTFQEYGKREDVGAELQALTPNDGQGAAVLDRVKTFVAGFLTQLPPGAGVMVETMGNEQVVQVLIVRRRIAGQAGT